MPDSYAKITLLEPYWPDEPERVLSIVYGREPARIAGGGYVPDPAGGEAVIASERAGAPARYIPGKRITYEIAWMPEDQRSAIVPEHVAKHWFGDWDIPISSDAIASNPERSYGIEKRRIAMIWGGYTKEQQDMDIKGSWKTLRIIAPPNIPKVLIQTLDSAMRVNPHVQYRPWEHFKWDRDVVVATPRKKQEDGLISVTPGQLQKMIEDQVSAAIKRGARAAA